MSILAIDSSTEACSVALLQQGAMTELYELAPREHSQRLLPMVDELLDQAELPLRDVEAIAFGAGPGSFTGLRICAGLVQGLAFGAGLPVIAVSSLQALAQTAIDQALVDDGQTLVAAIDARMDEVYWQVFTVENALAVPHPVTFEPRLSAPEQLLFPVPTGDEAVTVAVGSGWQYGERIPAQGQQVVDDNLLPRASAIARLANVAKARGELLRADQVAPCYVRNEIAWKKIDQQ